MARPDPIRSPAAFSVTALGIPPFAYQWRKGGANITGANNSAFVIASAQLADADVYSVVVTNDYGATTSSNATLIVIPTVPLSVALDTTGMVWTTDGNAPWVGLTAISHDGVDAAQSGAIADGQMSRLRTTVMGPGTLRFWWKVSSQYSADQLAFSYGGVPQESPSGEVDWVQKTVYLPAGSNTLEWIYSKDASGSAGQDKAWVDQVVFTAVPTAPGIIAQPAGQSVLAGTPVTFNVTAYGTPPLSYQWRFNGGDIPGATTSSFALARANSTNSGAYSVLVANAYGSVISSNALLGVVSIVAWGDNTVAQITVPPAAINVVAIAAGAWHSLALRADGVVVAWGNNWNGQCDVPAMLKDAVAIAGGGYHGLALKADRTVVAWGADYYGQATVPADLGNVTAIAAGTWHSLALRADRTVVAWGDNTWGQTTVPSGLSNVVAVSAGGNHNLVLKADGTVVAWGENTDAQGNFAGQSVVPWGLTGVVAISAGEYHSLALKGDSTVVAWGDNSQNQASPPTGLTGVIAISGGGAHSLALKSDGTLVAWGNNWNGQCEVPSVVTNTVAIAAGGYHTLALLDDGALVLRLYNPVRKGSQFSALLRTRSGKNYVLEFKNTVAQTNWTSLPAVTGNGALRLLVDPNATTPRRLYRVRQW